MSERKFEIGDEVIVGNLDGMTENAPADWFFGLFKVEGIGDKGIVIAYEQSTSPWPVAVEHDYGVFYYSETELERA